MENNLDKLILALYDIKVIKFGNFKLKSGVNSNIYFDLRTVVSYPKLMDLLTTLLTECIQKHIDKKFQHICGVPYTALPLATLVSAKTGVSMLIRRKETKDYGTRKTVEGDFQKGDECIIVEDVVTSGSSVLETIEDLKKESLSVTHAVVVLDREQGGVANLQNHGVEVFVLLTISDILNVLLKYGKVCKDTIKATEAYISNVKLSLKDSNVQNKGGHVNRLKMTFSERAKLTKNKMGSRLFDIMEAKKSMLCLAADVTNSAELLQLVSRIGPHICILKIHFDAIRDFSENIYLELMKMAKKENFLIMEDRKFSDIGNTVRLQFNQIKYWADLCTSHSLSGESTLAGLKSCVGAGEEKGCFLVAELSCMGNFITDSYSEATAKMAEDHSNFVVGLVCQRPELVKVPHLIQLTPGIKIEEKSDGLGQSYNDPELAVLEKGADVAVVGRGIILNSNPEKAAILYKEKLWKAYQKRLGVLEL